MENVQTRGRPRSFDCEQVLEQAMLLFWQQGYEGTSYADLTAATGLNKPSLYAAFGDKEALFSAVLDRYNKGPAAQLLTAFEASAYWQQGVRDFLRGYVEMYSDGHVPCGCMAATSLAESNAPGFPSGLRIRLQKSTEAAGLLMLNRARRAAATGELPAHLEPENVAAFLAVMVFGLASSIRAGATHDDLDKAVSVALQTVAAPEN